MIDLVNYAKLSVLRISSATFLPDSSIPPKMGPILGPPKAEFAAMPAT